MLCYVDDFIPMCLKPKKDIDALDMIYQSKGGFVPPGPYLGANVEKVKI